MEDQQSIYRPPGFYDAPTEPCPLSHPVSSQHTVQEAPSLEKEMRVFVYIPPSSQQTSPQGAPHRGVQRLWKKKVQVRISSMVLISVLVLSAIVAGLSWLGLEGNMLASTPRRSFTMAPIPARNTGPVFVWHTWTQYQIGEEVIYQGITYRCIQSHTSEPNWEPPRVPALWQAVS